EREARVHCRWRLAGSATRRPAPTRGLPESVRWRREFRCRASRRPAPYRRHLPFAAPAPQAAETSIDEAAASRHRRTKRACNRALRRRSTTSRRRIPEGTAADGGAAEEYKTGASLRPPWPGKVQPGVANHIFQPGDLGTEDASPEGGEAVIAAA